MASMALRWASRRALVAEVCGASTSSSSVLSLRKLPAITSPVSNACEAERPSDEHGASSGPSAAASEDASARRLQPPVVSFSNFSRQNQQQEEELPVLTRVRWRRGPVDFCGSMPLSFTPSVLAHRWYTAFPQISLPLASSPLTPVSLSDRTSAASGPRSLPPLYCGTVPWRPFSRLSAASRKLPPASPSTVGRFLDVEVPVSNYQRQECGKVTLPGSIFDVPIRKDIIHSVVRWQLAKRRAGLHSTKGVGEVRGTGRKPYQQKGSGRARHGSLRGPQFRGGATMHGPKPRSYDYALPKKIRRLGLRIALSAKVAEGKLKVYRDLEPESHKTRDMAAHLAAAFPGSKKFLLVDQVGVAEPEGATGEELAGGTVEMNSVGESKVKSGGGKEEGERAGETGAAGEVMLRSSKEQDVDSGTANGKGERSGGTGARAAEGGPGQLDTATPMVDDSRGEVNRVEVGGTGEGGSVLAEEGTESPGSTLDSAEKALSGTGGAMTLEELERRISGDPSTMWPLNREERMLLKKLRRQQQKPYQTVGLRLMRATSNLHYVNVLPPLGLNVYSILLHDTLVISEAALETTISRLKPDQLSRREKELLHGKAAE